MNHLNRLERLKKKQRISFLLDKEDPVLLIEERKKCEQSFYEFVKKAWKYVEGDREFVAGWHIKALCDHLEACFDGNIKYLVINLPPRMGKSLLLNVFFPAWVWTKKPWSRFLYSSYAKSIVVRDSESFLGLINSDWYKKLWGHKVTLVKQTIGVCINNSFGKRQISTIQSANTGHGGDYLIVDDPNNIKTLDSAIIREGTNLWWSGTMSSRYNNPNTVVRIICQQRGHEADLSGYVLAQKIPNLVHLKLPMEFEEANRTITVPLKNTNGKPWIDPRTLQGELLWPEYMGHARLQEFKAFLGSSYNIAGQLQQRPSPAEGGVLLKTWFQHWNYETLPKFKYYIQSWDTAMSTKQDAAYSAQTTWGVWDYNGVPNVMLISMWRGRVEYPELVKYIIRFSKDFSDMYPDLSANPKHLNKPDIILMEAKANGLSLIQDLSRKGVLITRFDPALHSIGASKYGSKVVRARLVSPILEAGRVWVPAKPPLYNTLYRFADVFVDACASFPNLESNDLVDSMTQALSRLINSGFIFHPSDVRITSRENWKDKPLY